MIVHSDCVRLLLLSWSDEGEDFGRIEVSIDAAITGGPLFLLV